MGQMSNIKSELKQRDQYKESKEKLKKKLSHISGSVEYAKIIKEKPDSVFVDGNRDNIGNSAANLRQISYEGKIGNRLSSGELDSLIRLKNKYLENDKNKGEVKGLIQNISVYPVVLFLWRKGTFVVSFLQPFIRRLERFLAVLEKEVYLIKP